MVSSSSTLTANLLEQLWEICHDQKFCNPGPSGIDDTHSNAGNDEESVMEEDVQEDDSHTGLAAIDRQATDIASSLVKTCLLQLCKCLHD